MPTYEYHCEKCGKAFARVEHMEEHSQGRLERDGDEPRGRTGQKRLPIRLTENLKRHRNG